MASSSSFNRRLIIVLAGLAVVQIGIAGGLGWKPSFEAGHFKNVPITNKRQQNQFDADRLRELEKILAPAPVLAWSDFNDNDQLPSDLAFKDSLLSFSDENIDQDQVVDDQAQPPAAPNTNQADEDRPSQDDERLALALNQLGQAGQAAGASRQAIKVAPVYFEKLPDLSTLTAKQRKSRFVAIMLPLIIRSNQELLERRGDVKTLIDQGDLATLKKWAQLYRIKNPSDDISTLGAEILKRVDVVPVSIALGQASIESGWGTSRFALQGNALFGQWAWSSDAGIRPQESRHETAVIRSFSTIFDSVRAYMHNLNTHRSYEMFRQAREKPNATSEKMIATLINYSEERELYLDKLNTIIAVNNFDRYDDAVLDDQN